jgi:hypothetical protein
MHLLLCEKLGPFVLQSELYPNPEETGSNG